MEFADSIKKWSGKLCKFLISEIVSNVLDKIDPHCVSIRGIMSCIDKSNSFFATLEFWVKSPIIPEIAVFSVELIRIEIIGNSKTSREEENIEESSDDNKRSSHYRLLFRLLYPNSIFRKIVSDSR